MGCFLCDPTKKAAAWNKTGLIYILKNLPLCETHRKELLDKTNPPNFQDREPGEDG